jgi:hypothetical protein
MKALEILNEKTLKSQLFFILYYFKYLEQKNVFLGLFFCLFLPAAANNFEHFELHFLEVLTNPDLPVLSQMFV